jgi:hypothetical protein
MRHAMASKASFPIALLVRRLAIQSEVRRLEKASWFITLGLAQGPRCRHWSAKKLDDLPEWDWYDISAHLKCMKCGSVGWVDTPPNWSEVINFNNGIG